MDLDDALGIRLRYIMREEEARRKVREDVKGERRKAWSKR